MGRTAKLHQLTATAVKAYASKHGTLTPLHDGSGLYLRKRDKSARWYLRLSDPDTGHDRWHLLGVFPQMSLADARQEADRLRRIRATGVDPRVERERVLQEKRASDARRVTVRALFKEWQGVELVPRVTSTGNRQGRKDGGAELERLFEARVFPRIGDMSVGDVRKADCMAILDRARSDNRLRTANVLLASLKQMFRFALVRERIDRNPLDTVSRRDAGGAEVLRDRVLSADEIVKLAAALPTANMDGRSACAVWLILATAVRVGEAMGARWEHIDLKARTWYLPDTKNQRDHTVHLSKFAVQHLKAIREHQRTRDVRRMHRVEAGIGRYAESTVQEQRRQIRARAAWVFPNSTGDKPVDIMTFGKQLADRQRQDNTRHKNRTAAQASLVLPGGRWTAHDLRRTAATMMAELGISADVIDECLNHVIANRVRRTYIRDRRLPEQARAFDALGARLELLATGQAPESNVVALREAA